MEPKAAVSPRPLARIAGGLYLINIVGGSFAIGYVPAAIVVAGDAVGTAHNLEVHEMLYRMGLLAHIAILCTNVGLAVIFYDLRSSAGGWHCWWCSSPSWGLLSKVRV